MNVGDRLDAARRHRFVGRHRELELLTSALDAPELPYQVIWLSGPPGVGKTRLLSRLAEIGRAQGLVVSIDGRNVPPAPDSFFDALRRELDLSPESSPFRVLAERPGRQLLLIDSYDALITLDDWLRESCITQLSSDTLVVLASRASPTAGWRSDPGWRKLVQTLPLEGLSPEESRVYLVGREVPTEHQPAILAASAGHPLSLALTADLLAQQPAIDWSPGPEQALPALVGALRRCAPDSSCRAALEAGAVVRWVTEALLRAMLSEPDVRGAFAWLRRLSFVDAGPSGLCLPEPVRAALVDDLRRDEPERYRTFYLRARAYYIERLSDTTGLERERLFSEYTFLHRDHPVLGPYPMFEREHSAGRLVTDWVRPADVPAVVEMVRQHEGPASSEIAAHWLARQPQGMLLARDTGGDVVGFVAMVGLDRARAEDLALDPGVAAAWRYVQSHVPLSPGEEAFFFRFWMAQATYQSICPVQGLLFTAMLSHLVTTPRLAISFVACAEPDFWTPMFGLAGSLRIAEADFEVDGRRFGMYANERRGSPPLTWLAAAAERSPAAWSSGASTPGSTNAALGQAEFQAAVRDALRAFTLPDALRRNPLLRSRLVVDRAGPASQPAERVAALRALLEEAVLGFQSSPRRVKFYRALRHTYLEPAASQEAAAELLELPFSTYRGHLTGGLSLLTELLWQREVG